MWEVWKEVYRKRYRTEPLQSAKQRSQMLKIIEQVGVEGAKRCLTAYINSNDRFYCMKNHDLGLALNDLQKMNTESNTGRKMTRGVAIGDEQLEDGKATTQAALEILKGEDPSSSWLFEMFQKPKPVQLEEGKQ